MNFMQSRSAEKRFFFLFFVQLLNDVGYKRPLNDDIKPLLNTCL